MKFQLKEGNYRILKKLTDKSSTCAIISPYRYEYTEEENKQRMSSLKADVKNLKSGFNQFISRWVENGEAFDEQALLISPITLKQAIELGEKYEQSSIIYKDSDSCKEICTVDFIDGSNTYSAGEVIRTFNTSSDTPLNIREAEQIFARKLGGPASKPIKGSNTKPFSLHTVENFELYEMVQPKPSTFSTEYSYKKIF